MHSCSDSSLPWHRLFFGLAPPDRERSRIKALQEELAPLRGRVAPDRLHITMGISGDFRSLPAPLVERMRAIGSSLRAAPARVKLDRLHASGHQIVLRPTGSSDGLRALFRELDGPLSRHGIRRAGWKYSPHLTLGYPSGRSFTQPIAPFSWMASEVILIHSVVGRTCHNVLGRWQLVARQGELFSARRDLLGDPRYEEPVLKRAGAGSSERLR